MEMALRSPDVSITEADLEWGAMWRRCRFLKKAGRMQSVSSVTNNPVVCVCVLCRDQSALSYTPLPSYWLPSKTNRLNSEKRLERPGRNTTCFLWATVCLMTRGGFLRHVRICTENCWRPASSTSTYQTGKRRVCDELALGPWHLCHP